jgi:hypothetical protein
MNSSESAAGAAAPPATPFTRKVRQRISAIPERVAEGDAGGERSLDGFSIARIYTTFQFKRDEYFPDGLSDAAFEILIDLFLVEWLNRRVGSARASGMRLAGMGDLPPGVTDLVALGLVRVAPAEADAAPGEPPATLSLSRAGRARLNVFFDYMASYIAAI